MYVVLCVCVCTQPAVARGLASLPRQGSVCPSCMLSVQPSLPLPEAGARPELPSGAPLALRGPKSLVPPGLRRRYAFPTARQHPSLTGLFRLLTALFERACPECPRCMPRVVEPRPSRFRSLSKSALPAVHCVCAYRSEPVALYVTTKWRSIFS